MIVCNWSNNQPLLRYFSPQTHFHSARGFRDNPWRDIFTRIQFWRAREPSTYFHLKDKLSREMFYLLTMIFLADIMPILQSTFKLLLKYLIHTGSSFRNVSNQAKYIHKKLLTLKLHSIIPFSSLHILNGHLPIYFLMMHFAHFVS